MSCFMPGKENNVPIKELPEKTNNERNSGYEQNLFKKMKLTLPIASRPLSNNNSMPKKIHMERQLSIPTL
ncbi:hypothetical protein BpHYR1_014565 [Brachionus plicatilis]|uniref:Uncharacterized protein n=1 Tax=Brachionus plicatilis TaxID=10195 RepID=A0A3M7PUG9_BRAPC|nr:hypothetical protein BpHYR1_014565 [Brachionus plicatilis]